MLLGRQVTSASESTIAIERLLSREMIAPAGWQSGRLDRVAAAKKRRVLKQNHCPVVTEKHLVIVHRERSARQSRKSG